ncbi:MAG: SDR family NAD(P)-dependent oxidoreductase [Alphaproteobacteria bacterium]
MSGAPFSLAGRRALVTGAAEGIGRAIATALDRAGATVWVTDIDAAGAARAAAALGRGGHGRIDVTREDEVAHGFREAIASLGGIDIVCANAGVSTMGPVVDLTEAEWEATMAVNAKGVFLVDREAVRHFRDRRCAGAIVNTASLAGKVGAPFLAHYSASKFAVVGFTQALAREVAAEGIRVNAVCPGFVRTAMQAREVEWEARLRGIDPAAVVADYVRQTPLGRLEEAEDVADVVVFLASEAARFMTGQAINVTGGVYTT